MVKCTKCGLVDDHTPDCVHGTGKGILTPRINIDYTDQLYTRDTAVHAPLLATMFDRMTPKKPTIWGRIKRFFTRISRAYYYFKYEDDGQG